MDMAFCYARAIDEIEAEIALLDREFLRLMKFPAKRALANALWHGLWELRQKKKRLFESARDSGQLLYCHPGYQTATAAKEAA